MVPKQEIYARMQKFVLTIACLLTACSRGNAPKAAAELVERPLLLWEVRKADTVSYLFGTCHLAIPLEQVLPEAHRGALSNARVLVNELDVSSMDPITATKVMWQGEGALTAQLDEASWRHLSVELREVAPAPMLQGMAPWAAYSMLMVDPSNMKQGGTPGLDQAVSAVADESELQHVYLETFHDQATMLSGMDAMFLELLSTGSSTAVASATQQMGLAEMCLSGDISAFEASLAAPESQEYLTPMFEIRNKAWMGQVLAETELGGAFVAVGAGHMVGEHGLAELLRKEGYEVTQLTAMAEPATEEIDKLNKVLARDPAPPPEASDAAETWTSFWASEGGAIDLVCAEEQLVRVCFEPDQEACKTRARADFELCARQWSDTLPASTDEGISPEKAQQLLGCGVTGFITEAIARDAIPDEPICNGLLDHMRASAPR